MSNQNPETGSAIVPTMTRRKFIQAAAAATAGAVVSGAGHELGVDTAVSSMLDPTKEWATRNDVAPASPGLVSRLGLSNTHEPAHETGRVEIKGEKVVVKGSGDRVLFDPNFDPQHMYDIESVAFSPNGSTVIMGVTERGAEAYVKISGEIAAGKYDHVNNVPAVLEPGDAAKKILIAPLKTSKEDIPQFVLKLPATKAVCFAADSTTYVIGGDEQGRATYRNDPQDYLDLWTRENRPIMIDVYRKVGDTGRNVMLSPRPSETIKVDSIHATNSKFSRMLAAKFTGHKQDVEAIGIDAYFESDFPDVVAVTSDGKYAALEAVPRIQAGGKIFSVKEMALIIDLKDPDNSFPVLPSDFPGGTNQMEAVKVVGTHDNNLVIVHTKGGDPNKKYRHSPVEIGLVVLNTNDGKNRVIPIQIPRDVGSIRQDDNGFVADFYDGAKNHEWLLPLSEIASIQAGIVKSEDTNKLWVKIK